MRIERHRSQSIDGEGDGQAEQHQPDQPQAPATVRRAARRAARARQARTRRSDRRSAATDGERHVEVEAVGECVGVAGRSQG